MKHFKKLPSIILICMLTFSLIIPVSGKAKDENIRAMLWSIVDEENGQAAIIEKYEELTGVKLEIRDYYSPVGYESYFWDVVDKIANNETKGVPDVLEFEPDGNMYLGLIKNKVIVPLDKYIKKSKVMKRIDSKHFETLKVNGKIYGFPLHFGRGAVTYIRKDWLDNLGLEIPTTWDELYEVMKAFTYNDPDGNGKDDTYGYALSEIPSLPRQMVFYADFFQGADYDFDHVNGRWIDGFVQENFKRALERLRQAYREKVIKIKDFEKLFYPKEEFYNGRCGMISYYAGFQAKELADNCKKIIPMAEVVAIPCIKGSTYRCEPAQILTIPVSCNDPKMVFEKFFEVIYDGGAGQRLFTYGVEDVHYKMNNGKYESMGLKNRRNKLNKNGMFLLPGQSINDWKDSFLVDEKLVLDSYRVLYDNSNYIRLEVAGPTLFENKLEIKELKEEIMYYVICGEYSAEEGIEKYKQKVEKYKVNQVLERYNQYK